VGLVLVVEVVLADIEQMFLAQLLVVGVVRKAHFQYQHLQVLIQ
jgi:hypothetical protein